MPRALIALGANLGDRLRTLQRAVERLGLLADMPPRVSGFHETTPIGGPAGQGTFLNAAALLETPLAPAELHSQLKQIEDALGRQRGERWAARQIDLDLLLYDDAAGTPQIVITPQLQVPHPRMAFRRFVLEPAAEVAAEMRHAIAGRTVGELLAHLNRSPPFVVVLGRREQQPAVLAAAVCEATGARFLDSRWAEGIEAVYSPPLATDDPSGRNSGAPIQLRDRGEVLAESGRRHSSWTITAVETDRSGRGGQTLDSLCPRLLVLLEPWETIARAKLAESPTTAASPLSALELAGRIGCPLLGAGASDPAAQLNEITAAIAAME